METRLGSTRFIYLLFTGIFLFWPHTEARAVFIDKGIEIASPIEKIFIPRAYSRNTQIELVLQGRYPSTCYEAAALSYRLNKEEGLIMIEASSYYDPDSSCLQVITPFIQTLKLGILEPGDYDAVLKTEPGVWANLHIDHRDLESPSEILAPVEKADLVTESDTGKQFLLLKGEFPHYLNGCMVLRDVLLEREQPDVLVVKPLADIAQGPECKKQAENREFEIRHGLREAFYGEGLLHVLTYQGQTLNVLISAPDEE